MVHLGFSVSPCRLRSIRQSNKLPTAFKSWHRSSVCSSTVRRLAGVKVRSSSHCFTVAAEAVNDASIKHDEDWGGGDFAHTDWDEDLPVKEGSKKGVLVGLGCLALLVWGTVESVNALRASRVVPSPANSTPLVSRTRALDGESSMESEVPTASSTSLLEDQSAFGKYKSSDEAVQNPTSKEDISGSQDPGSITVGGDDGGEDILAVSLDEEQSSVDIDMAATTSVAAEEKASASAEDVEAVGISGTRNVVSSDIELPQSDTLSASKSSQTESISSEPASVIQPQKPPPEIERFQAEIDQEDIVSNTEIEELVKDVSPEALSQRALLAARAASAASKCAQKAAECSVSASKAAAVAALAVERATAATGAAQAAMESGTKAAVIKAERKVVKAAQIASEAESRALSAASTAESYKDAANQQADIAEDLSAIKRLRGSTFLESIREKAPIIAASIMMSVKNAALAIWQWLVSLWHSMCESWPWLATYSTTLISKVSQLAGDISWHFRECAGFVGDFFDHVLSSWTTVSRGVGPRTASLARSVWISILGAASSVAGFFQDLLSALRSGLNL